MRRVEALAAAATGKLRALVVGVEALMNRMMPPERLTRRVMRLKVGMRVEPTALIARLVEAGYERTQLVEARGQWRAARRNPGRLPRGHARGGAPGVF